MSGQDAFTFLQGQFTNDLGRLDRERAVYGLWLTLKGKVLADSFIIRGRTPDQFWVGSYESKGALIRERLESYLVADEVVVEDFSEDWAGITVFDEGDDWMSAADGAAEALIFPGRRIRGQHLEWMFRLDQRVAVEAALGSRLELESEAIEWLRLTAAIPAIPRDLGAADLPGEAGLESDALSYTKGCYLGQEVMARLKAMGQVRRRLLRVRGPAGELPPLLPVSLFAGARATGELRSVARDGDGFIGFAMLTLMHVHAGLRLALAPEAPPSIDLVDAP